MNKNLLYIFFTFILLVQCGKKNEVEKPKNFIEKETFKNILIDVNLLEGYLTNLNVNLPNVRDESLGKYKDILTKHGVSYENYKENYAYYIQQEDFKMLQQEILDSLNQLEIELQNAPEIEELTFPQFIELIEDESLINLISVDSLSHKEIVDSIEHFYQINIQKVIDLGIDTVSLSHGLNKLRGNKMMFNSLVKKILNDREIKKK